MTATENALDDTAAARPRVAVFIDVENVSYKFADRIFQEANAIGDVVLRRAYADFSTPAKQWHLALNRHMVTPVHQFAARKGKNSSDIALTIDVMDILRDGFEGHIDVFFLVTSDADFSQVAIRVRQDGRQVVGIGLTPSETFVQSCNRFVSLADVKPTAKVVARAPIGADITAAVLEVVAEVRGEDGWAMLSSVGSGLMDRDPKFSPKAYGFKKLKELADGQSVLETETRSGGVVYIRQKDKKGEVFVVSRSPVIDGVQVCEIEDTEGCELFPLEEFVELPSQPESGLLMAG